MPILIQIILATIAISSLSLVGAVVLGVSQKKLHDLNLFLVALATGTLMGGAFFHLIPESIEFLNPRLVGLIFILGFSFFFILEKLFHWHHCHGTSHHHSEYKSLGYLNITIDLLHNFIDGLVIAGAFMVNPSVGLTTTIAVALHEIPQELGDFGILLHAGFKPAKALLFNFLTAWSALLGGIIGYVFLQNTEPVYLLPLTAGGFVYLAAADLIPEMKKETKIMRVFLLWLVFFGGLTLMWFLS